MRLPASLSAFRKQWTLNASNVLTLTNPKALKSAKLIDAPTAVLHLMPNHLTCPAAGSCAALCLNRAGNPAYLKGKLKARARRTNAFFNDRDLFMQNLLVEIVRFADKHKENQLRGVRLNGTSDIKWESEPLTVTGELSLYLQRNFKVLILPGKYRNIMATCKFINQSLQFYDYTKRTDRDLDVCMMDDYHLTVSHGSRFDIVDYAIKNNLNIAAPIQNIKRSQALPQNITLNGQSFPVVDGDITDWRVSDPDNAVHVVGLRLKRVPGMTQTQIDSFCLTP